MCKYIFRNKERCKEEALPNSGFCVLHIDLPELEADDFKRLNKLKQEKITAKTNNGDFNFEGAKLYELDFSGKKIQSAEHSDKNVNFVDAFILKFISFEGTDIADYASFESAKIGEHVSFKDAKIGGHIWFEDAEIGGDALFGHAEIGKDAWFEGTEIGGDALFENVKIGGDALFENAKISKNAVFADAKIGGDALFGGATIGKDVSFVNAAISGDIWFDEAKIGGDALFEGTEIEGRNVRFYHAEIKGDLNFKDTKFKTPKTQEEACRKAKRICEESDNREDADYHFYREMVARRQLRKQKIVFENGLWAITAVFTFVGVFIEWLLADVTCKYGSEWRRPIYLWAGVTVLCAVLFWLFGGIGGVDGSGGPSFLDALYFSIVTITTLGYGDYHPKAGLFQVLVGFEAVFGIFMWAVFIAIFARKHMR